MNLMMTVKVQVSSNIDSPKQQAHWTAGCQYDAGHVLCTSCCYCHWCCHWCCQSSAVISSAALYHHCCMTLHSGGMSGVHWRCCSTPRSGSSLTWCRPGFYSAAAGAHATDQQQQRNVSFTLLSIMSRGSAAPLFHISSAFLASMGAFYIVVHQQSSAVLVAFPNFTQIATSEELQFGTPSDLIVHDWTLWHLAEITPLHNARKTLTEIKQLASWNLISGSPIKCQCSVHLGADKNVFKPEFCSKQSHCWLTFANFFHSFNTSNSISSISTIPSMRSQTLSELISNLMLACPCPLPASGTTGTPGEKGQLVISRLPPPLIN